MENHQVSNKIKQKTFLNVLLKQLECSPIEVIKDLEEVCFFLTKPSDMLVHMAANLSSLSSPFAPWSSLLPLGGFTAQLVRCRGKREDQGARVVPPSPLAWTNISKLWIGS